MAEIKKENIKNRFQRMTGLGSLTSFSDLFDMAYAKLCALAGDRELSADEAAMCEYAAAADAAYAYTLEEAAKYELMFTEQGGARRRHADDDSVAAAKQRRDNAFAQLSGIIGDADFIFRAIEG